MRFAALIILACVWAALIVIGVLKRVHHTGEDNSKGLGLDHSSSASNPMGRQDHAE